jgi:hypothetical protein
VMLTMRPLHYLLVSTNDKQGQRALGRVPAMQHVVEGEDEALKVNTPPRRMDRTTLP